MAARRTRAIVVTGTVGADPDLMHALRACDTEVVIAGMPADVVARLETFPADAVFVDLVDELAGQILLELSGAIPDLVRLVAIGDPRALGPTLRATTTHCVVFAQP